MYTFSQFILFMFCCWLSSFIFFFNATATTEIYTLSLHDALPISYLLKKGRRLFFGTPVAKPTTVGDRKSTRLNSSHQIISYAVFCLKKKKKQTTNDHRSYT